MLAQLRPAIDNFFPKTCRTSSAFNYFQTYADEVNKFYLHRSSLIQLLSLRAIL